VKCAKLDSSLAGGGRYDQMIGKFLDGSREVPAVGIAFGLAPIMDVLKMEKEWQEKTPAEIFVIPLKTINESLKIIQQLREAGIKTDFDLNSRGVGKNLEYVNALGIPFALIIGEDELKQKKVLLRDMKTGEQQLLLMKDVVRN
jgi:histidyl-tRNA synthetase